jgi:tripartite-type tricarboxylate transporter receptor subunit TctC
LQNTLAELVKTPHVQERFTSQGLDVHASTPAAFNTYLRAEVDKWEKVVRAADIRAE